MLVNNKRKEKSMGEDVIKIIREIMADMKQYQFAELVGIDQ